MPAEFNVQIEASAPFDAGHATHNLFDAQASNRGNTVWFQIFYFGDIWYIDVT